MPAATRLIPEKAAENILQYIDAGTRPEDDDIRRKNDETRPKDDDTRPNYDDTRPNDDDTRPKHDDTSSKRDDTRLKRDDTRPKHDDARPKDDDTRPIDDDNKPKDDDARPKDDDARPKHDDTRHKRDDTRPKVDDTRHKRDDARPKDVDARPKERDNAMQYIDAGDNASILHENTSDAKKRSMHHQNDILEFMVNDENASSAQEKALLFKQNQRAGTHKKPPSLSDREHENNSVDITDASGLKLTDSAETLNLTDSDKNLDGLLTSNTSLSEDHPLPPSAPQGRSFLSRLSSWELQNNVHDVTMTPGNERSRVYTHNV